VDETIQLKANNLNFDSTFPLLRQDTKQLIFGTLDALTPGTVLYGYTLP
jgi:hypothetical protein